MKLHGRRGLRMVMEKIESSTGDIIRQPLLRSMPWRVVFVLITF
jgi:hypothetical protein